LTDNDFTQIKYWFDLGIKAIIGVVVSIVGMDYRAVKKSLQDVEVARYHLQQEVEVLKTELKYIKRMVERIDEKMDTVLNR
jgi:outer membrane protein W